MTPPPRRSLDEFANGEIDAKDVEVLRRTAAVYDEFDPVPAGLVDRIQFGITLDALQAEIADLQRTGDLAGVRSDETPDAHTVTFTSPTLTTMITITRSSGDRVRIDGWIAPGAPIAVELRVVDDTLTTIADEDGRFVFAEVPRGLAQFVLRAPDGVDQQAVVTPSIEI